MKRKLFFTAIVLLLALGLVAKQDKVTICHVPPGNPENAHSITVSRVAAYVHVMMHEGDSYGECDNFEPER